MFILNFDFLCEIYFYLTLFLYYWVIVCGSKKSEFTRATPGTTASFSLIKDLNYKCFPEMFQSIEKNEVYFSQSIKLSQKIMIQKNINWDDNDSKILQLIAQGEKTINLPNFIPLSLSTIEKRKANIKKQLILDNGSDKDLIDVAKNLGFI